MTITKGEYRLTIKRDPDPQNPRTDYDTFGTMYHWHPRMDVGDERIERPYDQEAYDAVIADYSIVVPVFMYEHSGVALSTAPFSCTFDSGQVGFIAVTMDKVRESFLIKPGAPVSDEVQAKAVVLLKYDVKAYDDYINGRAWGFELERAETCDCCDNVTWEHIGSCWGFDGDEDATRDAIGDHIADIHKHLLNDAWDNRS